ncbi:hypothetical protein HPP92_001758, partial [Vanilla planifolia]
AAASAPESVTLSAVVKFPRQRRKLSGTIIFRICLRPYLAEDALDILHYLLVRIGIEGATQITYSNGAAQNEDGDESAKNRNLNVVKSLMDLPSSISCAGSRCRQCRPLGLRPHSVSVSLIPQLGLTPPSKR